jgi:hypothetical protein
MGKEDPELRALVAGLMQKLDYTNQHVSEISERLASGVVNHVLQAGTWQLDTTGQYSVSWGATCGCVDIYNFSADTTMVIVPNQSGIVPTAGVGVHRIPFGVRRTVNINARSITVFGKAGDLAGIQAFTTGWKP